MQPESYQNESMPNVLIRDLPPHVHLNLKRQALAQGKSLQQYLIDELTALATTPTMEEIFQRIDRDADSSGFTLEEAVQAIEEGREERDSRWS